MPANATNGRLSPMANHLGVLRGLASAYSQNDDMGHQSIGFASVAPTDLWYGHPAQLNFRRIKQMGIFPKIVMLGLAAALSSPIRQQQNDFNTPPMDGVERINQLWIVTFVNEASREVVAQAKLTSGDYVPLIAADAERLESIMSAARDLAKTRNIKMRLVKLNNRLDIEDIGP
jgi:hypothetical protein